MINFKKIVMMLVATAFFCTLQIGASIAKDDREHMRKDPASNSSSGVVDCVPACGAGFECVCLSNMTCQCKIKSGKKEETKPEGMGGGNQQPVSAVTGCSSDQGIFSGLIGTGTKVFEGLRDLIYVVAGFGIIGVAVGGFFGNLNWKWLGAIVISLVVIATTGELITMITGCEDFTSTMIRDTLVEGN